MAEGGQHPPKDTADIKRMDEIKKIECTILIDEEIPTAHAADSDEEGISFVLNFYETHKTEELENALRRAERDARRNSRRMQTSIYRVRESIRPTCPAALDVESLACALNLKGKYIQAMILLRIAKDMHLTFPTGDKAAKFLQDLVAHLRVAAIEQLRSDGSSSSRRVVVQHGLTYMNEIYDDHDKLLDVNHTSGALVLQTMRIYDICVVLCELGMYEEVVSLGKRGIEHLTQIHRVIRNIGLLLAGILNVRARALYFLNRRSEATSHLRLAQTLREARSDAESRSSVKKAKELVKGSQERTDSREGKSSQSAVTDLGKLSKKIVNSKRGDKKPTSTREVRPVPGQIQSIVSNSDPLSPESGCAGCNMERLMEDKQADDVKPGFRPIKQFAPKKRKRVVVKPPFSKPQHCSSDQLNQGSMTGRDASEVAQSTSGITCTRKMKTQGK